MLEWVYRIFSFSSKNVESDDDIQREQIDLFRKKHAVKRIEKFYLEIKKNREIKKLRSEKRKYYRILNRTNPKLLSEQKKSHRFRNKKNRRNRKKKKKSNK